MEKEPINPEIFKEYCANANESLDSLENNLLELEHNPDSEDLLSNIFRGMHTMKGNSGFMQFDKTEKMAHYAEDILSKIRDGEMSVDSTKITAILASLDILIQLQKEIESLGYEPDELVENYQMVMEKLIEISTQKENQPDPSQTENEETDSSKAPALTISNFLPYGQALSIFNELKSDEQMCYILIHFDKDEPMLTPRGKIPFSTEAAQNKDFF